MPPQEINQVVQDSQVSSVNIPPVINQGPKSSIAKKVLIVVGILILVGVIAFGGYFGLDFYKNDQITIGKAIVNTIEAVSDNKIKSGEIASKVKIVMKDVGKNYSDLSTDENSKMIASQLQDVSLDFSYSGIFKETEDNKIEASGDIYASIKNPNGGSLGIFGSQEFGLKFKTFSDNIYVNVQTLPSLVSMFISKNVDANKYLNQWYSIPTNMTEQYSQTYTGGMSTTTITDDVKQQIISLFDESGAFEIINKKAEKTEKGTDVTAFYIEINLEKLTNELIKINQEVDRKNGIEFTKSKELEIRSNIEKIKEFPMENEVVKVLVGNDGYIYGFVSSADLMDKEGNKIGGSMVSFSADNINKTFKIERPENARSFMEVVSEISALMNSGSSKTTIKK